MNSLFPPRVEAKPAASVVLLRPSDRGPEILYLRRNPALAFHGGYWVFPGGRIDDTDYWPDAPKDQTRAARRAAIREASEEAGVTVEEDSLEFAVHWTTPEARPIRFSTWFFVAPASEDTVHVDGGEIHDHRWLRPDEALRLHREGKILLAAPTFALTTRLGVFTTVDTALAAVAAWSPEHLLGRSHDVPDGKVAVYAGDVAYDDGGLDKPGPHHRLWMLASGWRYERSF